MRRTAQLLRSLLSILVIAAGQGIQFLWLAVSSRAELGAEVLFLRKQLAFYEEHEVQPRKLTYAARLPLALWSQLFNWRAALVVVKPETLVGGIARGSSWVGGGSRGWDDRRTAHEYRLETLAA